MTIAQIKLIALLVINILLITAIQLVIPYYWLQAILQLCVVTEHVLIVGGDKR